MLKSVFVCFRLVLRPWSPSFPTVSVFRGCGGCTTKQKKGNSQSIYYIYQILTDINYGWDEQIQGLFVQYTYSEKATKT